MSTTVPAYMMMIIIGRENANNILMISRQGYLA